ncbi:hypothetical protein D9M71_683540 [compost metagenome]
MNPMIRELFRDAAPKTVGELIQVESLRLDHARSQHDPLARRWALRKLFALKGWPWTRWSMVNC